MAICKAPFNSRRSSKVDADKDGDSDDDGYVQIYVKPMDEEPCGYILNWIGIPTEGLNSHKIAAAYGIVGVLGCVCVYQIFRCDFGLIFHRLCGFIIPTFSIVCVFYWLSFYLRKTWSTMSIYLLFISCYSSETLALLFVRSSTDNNYEHANVQSHNDDDISSKQHIGHSADSSYVFQPLVILCIMLSISFASIFSSLETVHSALVIVAISFTRLLACTSLTLIPSILRPYIAYTWAFCGILVSKYMETILSAPINNLVSQDGKIPVIKRRRSSSSGSHPFSVHRSNRRTSLPALTIRSQSNAASYDSAIIREAHGLITDMLAESNLPPHVISGLRAVGNLLKPTENHSTGYKPRVSPLVSLTESANYGSDTEDSPYTGERPTTLPKRLRRSLPPSLIRRMSTSTWTTTTSATGMPTVEMEPCRLRSSSFRQQRAPDNTTPGSSPTASRSNSPSPSSPSTVTLSIPKARSFSVSPPSLVTAGNQKRTIRKSVCFAGQTDVADGDESKQPSEAADRTKFVSNETRDALYNITSKRFNITSDYESSDSPNSSDHSDNIVTSDEFSMSPPKKFLGKQESSPLLQKHVTEKTEASRPTSTNSLQKLETHATSKRPTGAKAAATIAKTSSVETRTTDTGLKDARTAATRSTDTKTTDNRTTDVTKKKKVPTATLR